MINIDNLATMINLLDQLADRDNGMDACSGPADYCTVHGNDSRGFLDTDEEHECVHRRAHKLLVDMGIRSASVAE